MTTTLFAPTALLPDGWARDVRLTIDGARIAAVEPGAAPGPGDHASPAGRSSRRCPTCTATPSSARWPA